MEVQPIFMIMQMVVQVAVQHMPELLEQVLQVKVIMGHHIHQEQKPALVVVGLNDRITPPGIARATARNLTGQIDYQELPGAPHWLFWGELEDRVTAMVVDWLKTLS